MKLIQILMQDNVRCELLNYWENKDVKVHSSIATACNSILKDNGYAEEFKYATYYEYLTPIIKERSMPNDDELAQKEILLLKAQKRVNRERKYVHRHLNYDVRFTEFEEMIKGVVDEFVPIKLQRRKIKNCNTSNVGRVFLSDFHHTTTDASRRLIESTVKSVFDNATGDFELIITGDIIQGCLRDDDLVNGNYDIVQQILEFVQIFTDSVYKYGDDEVRLNNLVKIVIIPGNHDRVNLVSYKGAKVPSMAKIAHQMFEHILQGLDIVYTDEYVYHDHLGDEVKVVHGHLTGGKNNLKKYYKGKVVHAHFHHYYKDGDIIGLPALCPSNEFEKSLGLSDSNGGTYVIEHNGWWKECHVLED